MTIQLSNFSGGTFYDGGSTTSTYSLPDDAYRKLILIKALANISATNAPALNQLLQNLFAGRGRAYVSDQGNMSMRYTFEFDLTPTEYSIVTNSGALPRPAGVSVKMLTIDRATTFGFSEALANATFGEGTFISSGATSAVN